MTEAEFMAINSAATTPAASASPVAAPVTPAAATAAPAPQDANVKTAISEAMASPEWKSAKSYEERRQLILSRMPKPDIQTTNAMSIGVGKGITAGLSTRLGAGIDTAISKVPGLRNVAESVNAIGGHPGLSPLTTPLSYDERLAEYANRGQASQQQHPVATAAGEVAGGAMLASAAPTTTLGGSMAATGAQGAIANAADSAAPIGSPEMLSQGAKGAVVGAVGGALGHELQALAKGAPAAVEDKTMRKIAGRAGSAAQDELEYQRPAIFNALKEHPEVRAQVGKDAAKLKAAADEARAGHDAIKDMIYSDADASNLQSRLAEHQATVAAEKSTVANEIAPKQYMTPSQLESAKSNPVKAVTGVEPNAITEAAEKLSKLPKAPSGGVDVSAVKNAIANSGVAGAGHGTAISNLSKQFSDLTKGRETIPAKELRAWITNELGPNTLPSADSAIEGAKKAARISARDVLHSYVEDNLGPEARKALETHNAHSSALSTISDVAGKTAKKDIYQPAENANAAAKRSILGKTRLAGKDAVNSAVATPVGQVATEAAALGAKGSAQPITDQEHPLTAVLKTVAAPALAVGAIANHIFNTPPPSK